MTARETMTLEKLAKRFDDYVEDDNKWKKEIETQLTPLVDERLDRMVIVKYGGKALKVLSFFIAILAGIGSAWKYLIGPMFGYK